MIQFEGVSRAASGPPGPRRALDDISFSLNRGETVALMGANGSGKTTLCRCANGLLTPDAGCVRVDGLSTADAGALVEIRRRVGMVFQDPTQQLVTWSVEDEMAFGPENLGLAGDEIDEAVRRAIAEWGLEELRGRHPGRLSGGQAAAVALASVMVMEPCYLVVDEASSLLDRAGRRRLLEALRGVRACGDVGVLWVTQFPEEAALCDRLVLMNGGRIVAEGAPDVLLADVSALRKWGLEPPPCVLISGHLKGLGFPLRRLHIQADRLAAELDTLGLGPPAAAGQCPAVPCDDLLLRVDGAMYAYEGGRSVFSDMRLEVRRGEAVALAGPSGSGKSTLSFLACGALEPVSGIVERPPAGEGIPTVGLCAQFPEEQFCASTVRGEVAVGLGARGLNPVALSEMLETSLSSVGLDAGRIADRSPLSLSEGEKKKVALACALTRRGSLLVLDEPTLGLDGPSAERALAAIRDHVRAGGGALIASHSGDFLLRSTRRLLVLDGSARPSELSWEDVLSRYREWEKLPEGPLLELLSRTGARADFNDLGSFESVAQRLAARLGPPGPEPRRAAPDGLKRAAGQGKCP